VTPNNSFDGGEDVARYGAADYLDLASVGGPTHLAL
jgi:hypothetical protein